MSLFLSGDKDADELLSKDPFALLIGMVLDQQIPLERAFSAPYELRDRLKGKLDPKSIARMDPAKLAVVFSERPALHRFPAAMAERVQAVAQIIVSEYKGDSEAIWSSAKTGDELLARIRALPGFGEQKAKIFVALLGKQLGIRPPGWDEVAGDYAKPGTHASIADIDGPEARLSVRAYKRDAKTAAKTAAPIGTKRQAALRSGK